jgi:RimJ/RimL family protein N-acetyltransferase
VSHPYWPIFDLRLRIGMLVLRPTTEADLRPLADLKPADVEQDPALPVYPVEQQTTRGTAVFQEYWRSLGSWRPGSWRLGFVAHQGKEIVGTQELLARDFPVLRTVETASWMPTDHRGKGIGKAMRLAVLALAFDGLGAQYAHTEAWHDNGASLGVSRALGYLDNGAHRHARGEVADEMVAMRLDAQRWRELHADHDVSIEGLLGCEPWFGSDADLT